MAKKTIAAWGNHIIVEILKQDSVSDGGIFIPVNAEKEPQGYGKIISIGPKVEAILTAQVGSVLAFAKFAGQDIIIDGKILKVLKDSEVYGSVVDDESQSA